jgi:hypothetical protein
MIVLERRDTAESREKSFSNGQADQLSPREVFKETRAGRSNSTPHADADWA